MRFHILPGVSIANFEQVNVSCVISSLSTTYNTMYLSETRLVNLVLTKAVFQLLCLEMHTPNVWFSGDIFFQKTFSNWCDTLPHSETVKRHVI